MTITILAFGIAKELLDGSSVDVEVNNSITAMDLKEMLETKYPALRKSGSYRIAVNNEFADEQTMIHESDEIAVIPPVSGG